jgi:hypothetical protein
VRCLSVLCLPPYSPVCSCSVGAHTRNKHQCHTTHDVSVHSSFLIFPLFPHGSNGENKIHLYAYISQLRLGHTAADKQSASSRIQLGWRQRRRLSMRFHPRLHKQISTRYMTHPDRQLAQCSMQEAWAQRSPPAERLCLHSGCCS